VFANASAHDESLNRWGPSDESESSGDNVVIGNHARMEGGGPSSSLSVRKSPGKKKGGKMPRSPVSALQAPPPVALPTSTIAAENSRKIILHDQYVLMQRARACMGVEHVYVWFDHFLNHAQPWVVANARKRKAISLEDKDEDAEHERNGGGELSDSDMLQMRCRFHLALHDLLRTGVIALKNNGTAVAKQCFSWMMD